MLLAESVKLGTAVKGERQCCLSSVCLFVIKVRLVRQAGHKISNSLVWKGPSEVT